MKVIKIEELKKIQLDILTEIDTFCRKNNIKYFLGFGTLLGAIRHKGYIPWDDDIDICMPRESYDRFIQLFNSNISNIENAFKVRSIEIDEKYIYPFAKVENINTILKENMSNSINIGVNIDLFPIDAIPNNEFCRKIYYYRVQLLRNLYNIKVVRLRKNRNIIKNAILIIGKFFLCMISVRQIAILMNNIIDKSNNKSNFVQDSTSWIYKYNSYFSRSSMCAYIDVEFEKCTFKAMIGYDDYLTKTFGDYMTLPPKNQRISTHTFKAYWK
jgi:lipopolysaccharide cholinephosphotransferase